MEIDYEVISKVNDIATGGKQVLTRGQVAAQTVDISKFVGNMVEDRAERAIAYYNSILDDKTEKEYDLDSLEEERSRIISAIEEHIKEDTTTFEKLFAAIERFFISPPFEGMDAIPYGVCEVCVFSVVEYFAGDDHEELRSKYLDNLTRRIGPENGKYWMDIFNGLQARYEGLELKMCCQIAISAMLHQSEKYFDELRQTALSTDTVSDNAIVLAEFVERQMGK